LAAAGAGTLAVIGTQAARRETLTATALWPADTATPTVTPTTTMTASPTDTATPTATPLPSGNVVAADWLRAGPGAVYPVVIALTGGESARPLGKTEGGDWLLIVLEAGEQGWVPAENFVAEVAGAPLPIIVDLPPTPTQPAVTLTPAPTLPPATATHVLSPYTCDLSISREGAYIILIGYNWPPGAPIAVQVIRHYAAPVQETNSNVSVTTGDEDDEIPNGFWFRWSSGVTYFDGATWIHVDGPTTYTLSTWACVGTAMTGP
jgi:hypothetical protein